MKKTVLTAFVAVAMALSMAGDAWAKAGKSSSLGSRGSRTNDRPIERTYTPPPAAKAAPQSPVQQQPLASPQQQPAMAAPQPMAQPGFFQRNPLLTGVMGGLVGAGIGSMLFGHSPALAAASDAAPMASMFGTLLQIALIGGLGWMLFRMFRRKTAPQTDASVYAPAPDIRHGSAPYAAAPIMRTETEFDVEQGDFQAFTDVLVGVQTAWSNGDLSTLRKLATPEVVGWMSEDLSRDQSMGVRNVVSDVTLEKGEVTESWRDEEREYVTALITFSCLDYMVRQDSGAVVEGNSSHPVTHTELWTFLRAVRGGQWLLSAIEQPA